MPSTGSHPPPAGAQTVGQLLLCCASALLAGTQPPWGRSSSPRGPRLHPPPHRAARGDPTHFRNTPLCAVASFCGPQFSSCDKVRTPSGAACDPASPQSTAQPRHLLWPLTRPAPASQRGSHQLSHPFLSGALATGERQGRTLGVRMDWIHSGSTGELLGASCPVLVGLSPWLGFRLPQEHFHMNRTEPLKAPWAHSYPLQGWPCEAWSRSGLGSRSRGPQVGEQVCTCVESKLRSGMSCPRSRGQWWEACHMEWGTG